MSDHAREFKEPQIIRGEYMGIPCEIVALQDIDGIGCPKMVEKLVALSKYEWIMFLGDDTIPGTGFLLHAFDAIQDLPDHWGVVGLNTQDDRPGCGCNEKAHWMAHKKMLGLIPGGDFFSTEYNHCYGDDELYDIANEHGRWTFAEDCRILHDHPVNGTATYDEGYQKAYDNGKYDEDLKTYYRRKIQRKGFNIGVGFPLTGTQENRLFSASYRQAVYTYLKMEGVPSIREYEPDIPIGQFARDIAHNRNDLIRQALADGVSHLIMMDTDQIYPKDVIIKLAAHAARGKDVVIAPVHRRYEPFELILVRGENPDKYITVDDEEKYSGDLIGVDAGGSGCMMFSTLAALNVGYPWFTLDDKTPSGGDMGEDISFCWKLRKQCYQIWADTSIEIGHVAEIVINREFHEIWKRLNKKAGI
jgi:hypothetical protein